MNEEEINQLPELDSIFKDEALTKPRNYPRMKKRTKAIVRYIERNLGGDVLEVELTPSQIKDIIDDAFDELKHYISDTYTITVPFSKCIDLKKYNIDAIDRVMRSRDSILTGVSFLVPIAMYPNTVTGTFDVSDYANALQTKKNLNIISTDMDYVWDKPNRKLYITANPQTPDYITISFKPEYYSCEDIREDYWDTQLRKLSLAMAKIITGRIRSKYTPNNSTFGLDGPTMLQEGLSELQAVRSYLDENRDNFKVLN
ncbi:hypothetical protein [uncultured Clostridium sp.]|uniref:hypothetical protein n=1 Tax=uncultured Clostridium sp. TaxID=59620 RepID=UPI0026EC34AD|nr:hypothetical protein [uncultured Clostridium sp.]